MKKTKEQSFKVKGQKKLKRMQGITLVALVVTIVILLILAGITLVYVLGDNSVFKQASEAKLEYQIAQAREKLEITFGRAQILKHTEPKYNQDDYLDNLMKNEISNIKIEDDIVIVDGFAFEIDRSIPTIGKYVGEEKELTFPKVQLSKSIAEDLQTATITIKAKEEKNGINKIVIMQRGFIIETFTYDNEKEEITIDYDKITRNGKYTVKVYGALSASAIIEIEGLVPSIEYTPIGNLEYKKEHQVKILVKEAGDKVASIKYQWSNELTEPEDNTFTKTCNREETIIQTGVTVDWYLWTLLETESGFKRKERSETFKFDNQGPTVTLTSMPVSETEFTLTATAEDEHTAPKECKFYVGGELKETKDISSGTASYDVTVESMGDNYNCYVIVTDTLGNETKQTVTSKTKMHTWDKWNINTTTTYAEGSWSSWKMLDKVIGDNTCARESYSFDKNTGMYTTKRRRNSTH